MNRTQTLLLSVVAIATTTTVTVWLPTIGHSNDLTPFSQGTGVTQSQINRLRWYATGESCTPEGCMLTVNQSSGAILSLLGGASEFDQLRNVYPILDSSDGVSEPAKLVVYFQLDGDAPARADEIWIPVFSRVSRTATGVAPINGTMTQATAPTAAIQPTQPPEPVQPPELVQPPESTSSLLPPGMSQDEYQRLRRGSAAGTNAAWRGSN